MVIKDSEHGYCNLNNHKAIYLVQLPIFPHKNSYQWGN